MIRVICHSLRVIIIIIAYCIVYVVCVVLKDEDLLFQFCHITCFAKLDCSSIYNITEIVIGSNSGQISKSKTKLVNFIPSKK